LCTGFGPVFVRVIRAIRGSTEWVRLTTGYASSGIALAHERCRTMTAALAQKSTGFSRLIARLRRVFERFAAAAKRFANARQRFADSAKSSAGPMMRLANPERGWRAACSHSREP
jgi:hypothetical protein